MSASLTDGTTTLEREQVAARLNGAVGLLRELTDGTSGRVAVMAHNSVETVLTHAAVILAGLSAVPVSFHLTAGEVAYLLETSSAALLVVDADTAEVAADAAARVGGVRVLTATELAVEGRLRDDLTSVRPRPPLLFTSGTTGRPKPVEQPPTMFPRVDSVAELLTLFAENPLAELQPHLVVGPLYHTGPLTAVRLLLAGTPLVVMRRFDAEGVLRAIQDHRIEASVMVPTHFSRLLALPDEVRASYDVSSLRQVVHTGSACPVDVKRRMIAWWGPVLVEAYGGTEVGTTTSLDSEEWLAHPGSVGRAVPPFEVLVLDEEGHEVPTGVPGQLCFRDTTGRGLVYALDGLTGGGTTYGPGVFTLGEVGRVDEDGYVYITDRTADLVVSGGVNVYPAEVERVLLNHPHVEDVAVFGVPVEDLGEELRALVVAGGEVTAVELMTLCRSELAGFKCPRRLDLVEALPRTTMGKLDKRALRERYGAGVSTSEQGI